MDASSPSDSVIGFPVTRLRLQKVVFKMETRIMVLTVLDMETVQTKVYTFSSFENLRTYILTLLPTNQAYSLIKHDTLFSKRHNSHYLIHYTTLDSQII